MAISKVVLECPFCNEIFEAESPDRLHSAYSLEKPIASSYHGDVVKKKAQMPKPRMQKTNYNLLVRSNELLRQSVSDQISHDMTVYLK